MGARSWYRRHKATHKLESAIQAAAEGNTLRAREKLAEAEENAKKALVHGTSHVDQMEAIRALSKLLGL